MTKEKNRKILKRIFGQMCIAQKTTGLKTSIKTEIASQQQMLAFLRKDISSKYLKNSR